jgi:hypothetical protein
MDAFLTGSRIYGTPTSESDLDLVIFLSKSEAYFIMNHADKDDKSRPIYDDDNIFVCRYGKLNLIMLTDEDDYNAWKCGTKECLSTKPVTRDFAKAAIIYAKEFNLHNREFYS